jgi:hypothetical protein
MRGKIMIDDRRNWLQLPPEYRTADLILAGWSAEADLPVIHYYDCRYDEVGVNYVVIPGDGRADRVITLPLMLGVQVPDVIKPRKLRSIMRQQAAQAEAESGRKSIRGDLAVATVFRRVVHTEIVGSIETTTR